MHTFIAQYRSRCNGCDDYIDEGDECAYYEDEVMHAECAEDAESRDSQYHNGHGGYGS